MYLNCEVIEKLKGLKKRYQDISNKLTFEEVLIDEKLTIRLSKEKALLEPIVEKFDQLEILESQNNDKNLEKRPV